MFFRGMLATVFMISVGCGGAEQSDNDLDVASDTKAISVNALATLDWANDWISEVKAQPSRLSENEYTASSTDLVRMGISGKAKNRNVCGTLVSSLLRNSLGYTSDDFYHSFNKAMDGSCEVGTVSGRQAGTTSPNAAQYRYKIANCGGTGSIRFTRRNTISAVQKGDVLAVSYPERTDITGHVMIVRSAPVVDKTLPAGPSGSTAYAVEIIDSTSTPHGSASKYPDWRGGNTRQGLGTGTFVLYANASGAIVASRWSPTDSVLSKTSANPLAIGGPR